MVWISGFIVTVMVDLKLFGNHFKIFNNNPCNLWFDIKMFSALVFVNLIPLQTVSLSFYYILDN